MAASYLHRCLELFAETMHERHGWRPDYEGLEKALEPVRRRSRGFSFRDLETIQNPRYWDFRQFWRFPAESDIRQEIEEEEMARLIRELPLDEARAIGRLHAAFKFIENVSVVLRFVHPDHYGILSPPVEKVLEVRRGRTQVETYLNYLADLRALKAHHRLERAADADMALWVLQERVLSSYRDHELLREFRCDTWLLRRKAVNLLAELAEADQPLELARALCEVHLPLAAAVACHELERRLHAAQCAPGGPGHEQILRGRYLHERAVGTGARPSRVEVLEMIRIAQQLAPAPPDGA
ncbi:MAG TPA: hypothetical protein VFP98_01285 [Candidatus Polarisedimenticolia bacterium]|nr:hypothetical protein [Candidatus Polarisedimenticolia bacterium]